MEVDQLPVEGVEAPEIAEMVEMHQVHHQVPVAQGILELKALVVQGLVGVTMEIMETAPEPEEVER